MDKKDYLASLSHCVRCGSCKAPCPTYDNDPSEGMGARGRLVLIRSLLAGDLKPSACIERTHIQLHSLRRLLKRLSAWALIYLRPYITAGLCSGKAIKKEDFSGLLQGSRFKWPDMSFKIMKMSQRLFLPLLARKGIIPFRPGFS